MLFGESPRLLLTFMRSYQNFGRALVWLDDDLPAALHRVHVNDCYTESCFKNFPNALRGVAQSLANATTRCSGRDDYLGWMPGIVREYDVAVAQECQRHFAGARSAPFTLDGWWSDRSSQAHTQGFMHGFQSYQDMINRGANIFVEHVNVSLLPNRTGSRRHSSGVADEHLVHLAMLTDPGVHAGLHGTKLEQRALFKLMGVRSC